MLDLELGRDLRDDAVLKDTILVAGWTNSVSIPSAEPISTCCWALVGGLASLEGRVKDRRRPEPRAEADGISLDVLDEGREDMASPKVPGPRSGC
jgi:hypothetical protein